MDFFELIHKCINEGTKEKERLLMEHKGNTAFKELFKLMLDTSIVYNIKAVPSGSRKYKESYLIDTDFALSEAILCLISEDLRGHELQGTVARISNDSALPQAVVLEWVLARKNPAEIGVSLVNKVWPGLIYTQMYMGAVPGTVEALDRLPWKTGVNVQVKEDGMTFLVHYFGGVPYDIRTRQGQSIGKYFPEFLSSCPVVFDVFNGFVHHEALVYDRDSGKVLDRQTGNGLINQQVKNGVIGGDVDNCIHSVLLDLYHTNSPEVVQEDRYIFMSLFESQKSNRVTQCRHTHVDEAKYWAKLLIRKGGEGVICKDPEKPFKDGKPWWNVKIKNEFSSDLQIIDTKPHSKVPGLIGAVLCASRDRELEVWVNMRCDSDRSLALNEVQGAIVQVRAESVITSKSKTKASLYLPRMDGESWMEYVRLEKNQADSYEEIKWAEQASKEI
jgi:hypothetical protein